MPQPLEIDCSFWFRDGMAEVRIKDPELDRGWSVIGRGTTPAKALQDALHTLACATVYVCEKLDAVRSGDYALSPVDERVP